MEDHVHVRVVGLYVVVGGLDLGPAHVSGVVQHLPLQVGQLNHVEVNDSNGAHPSQRKVDGGGRTQPTGAYD